MGTQQSGAVSTQFARREETGARRGDMHGGSWRGRMRGVGAASEPRDASGSILCSTRSASTVTPAFRVTARIVHCQGASLEQSEHEALFACAWTSFYPTPYISTSREQTARTYRKTSSDVLCHSVDGAPILSWAMQSSAPIACPFSSAARRHSGEHAFLPSPSQSCRRWGSCA